ncbi:flavin-containing monooxygenase [Angustibacter sp. McL0619]|uniref:flavin-containing monooxygenase n=1 Tax=Angustibacter sp. McL0619 TaxID=3415676 RepID=UPI003CF0AC5B
MVVGAGAAGLAVSRCLAEVGVEHLVLERHDVADTWRSQRWDSFTLNTPDSMNDGLHAGPDLRTTRSRDEVVQLLAEQAQALPVRTHTPVTAVDSIPKGFLVATPDGTLTARTLVLAAGLRNVPRVPAQAKRVAPRVHQLHTADYRSASQLPDGAVLVVGGGQSGCQIAEDLSLAGRTVYLSTSRVGRIPWLYRGRESLVWLVDCGFWDQSPHDLPDPADMELTIPLLAGGRSLDLRILSGLGVRLVGRFISADGETIGFEGSPSAYAAQADEAWARLRNLVDHHIEEQGIVAPDPATERRPSGPVQDPDTATLDLRAADVTTLIWSTGFTGDLSWVHLPLLGPTGRLEHDGCTAPWPGVWYVGFPWLTRRCSGIFYGFSRDARSIVHAVLHELDR